MTQNNIKVEEDRIIKVDDLSKAYQECETPLVEMFELPIVHQNHEES